MKKIEYEKCVVCHQETEVKKDEPIQNRQFYVIGAYKDYSAFSRAYHGLFEESPRDTRTFS